MATSDFKISAIGKLKRTTGSFPTTNPQNVEIAYEHGMDAPPADIREAALRAIRSRILVDKSAIPERTVSVQAGAGALPVTPRESEPTGVPSVDDALNRHRLKLPGIA